jgi:hypothetical protein
MGKIIRKARAGPCVFLEVGGNGVGSISSAVVNVSVVAAGAVVIGGRRIDVLCEDGRDRTKGAVVKWPSLSNYIKISDLMWNTITMKKKYYTISRIIILIIIFF